MARRKRDYKAEYAASKRRATNAGYKSEREYKAVRKRLQLPRGAMPAPKRVVEMGDMPRLRRESKHWSQLHSLRRNSRYRESMTDAEVRLYHAAFVEPVKDGRTKRRRLKDYLTRFVITPDEWNTNPSTVPLRR